MSETESTIKQFFLSLDSINKKLEEFEKLLIKKNNISSSSFKILNNCSLLHSASCKEISFKANLSVSRASRIIDRMVREDLLIRKCDQSDRRRCELKLSNMGKKIKSRINHQINELRNNILKNFKIKDITETIHLIDSVCDNISIHSN